MGVFKTPAGRLTCPALICAPALLALFPALWGCKRLLVSGERGLDLVPGGGGERLLHFEIEGHGGVFAPTPDGHSMILVRGPNIGLAHLPEFP